MDFSSIPRALESLARRQPPLDGTALEACNALARAYSCDDPVNAGNHKKDGVNNQEDHDEAAAAAASVVVVARLTALLEHPRWEALAVGLYVSTEVLAGQRPPSIYMEGPRVPIVFSEDATVTTTAVSPVSENESHATAATEDRESIVGGPGTAAPSSGSHHHHHPSVALAPEQVQCLRRALHTACLQHLEHPEPRVRTLVAKAVGAYVQNTTAGNHYDKASAAFHNDEFEYAHEVHDRLVSSIRTHLELGRHIGGGGGAGDNDKVEPQHSQASTVALDDTTGWRALETSWQCLASLVHAMGPKCLVTFPFDDQILEDCQYSAIKHVNRHVRAAAMNVLEQWIRAAAASTDPATYASALGNPVAPLRQTAVEVLRTGLADNWSQVRMAASVLCRVFLTTLRARGESLDGTSNDLSSTSTDSLEDIYLVLLPRMCLNRYYLAQGVKLYSHETWFLVVQDRGIDLVAQYLPAVVRYYSQMCDADNHVVREAACQAISELAVRLGSHPVHHAVLAAYVEPLLQSLLVCFHDESWPVRDEACLACAILCKSYPDLCRDELPLLWDRWTEQVRSSMPRRKLVFVGFHFSPTLTVFTSFFSTTHVSQLTDQIWSVRQDAAVALGDAVEAYPELWPKVLGRVRKLLPSARDQPPMTRDAYKAHQNDANAHTGAQMYSCGSLAPKLQKKAGAGRIGCSSCGIDRPKAPWEATDGSIYLIRELIIRGCGNDGTTDADLPFPLTDDVWLPLLRELADVCRVQHFPQSDDLRTTLWRQLPVIAHALGKDRFKRHYLELFVDLLFRTLDSRSASQLSMHAAGQCADDLAALVGRAVFRGRLDEVQRDTYDRVMKERALHPKGPSSGRSVGDSGCSPHGPPGLLDEVNRKRFAPLASAGGH